MPVKKFSLKGNMNLKKHNGGLGLNNLGMSPIIIVVVVFVVLVLGVIGYGVYFVTNDPYFLVYRSYSTIQNSEKIKNMELDSKLKVSLNAGKLLKNSESFKNATSKDLEFASLVDFDTDILVDAKTTYEISKNDISYFSSQTFKVSNFKIEKYPDIINSDGTFLALDAYISQEKLGEEGKTPRFLKYYMKLNQLPNYIVLPSTSTSQETKIKFDSILGIWVDLTDMFNGMANQNKEISENSTISKSVNVLAKTTTSNKNSLVTCGVREDLNFIERVRVSISSRGMFSRFENLGNVEEDGVKLKKVVFELDRKDKAKFVKSLNDISNIVCKNKKDLDNSVIADLIFGNFMDKISVNYYIDTKENLMMKTDGKISFDESELGSKVEINFSGEIKNINKSKINVPSDVKPYNKFLQENVMPLQNQLMQSSGSSSNSTLSSSQKCLLPESEKLEFMKACTANDSSMLKRNYCNCALNQLGTVACNDIKGFEAKVKASCLSR